MNKRLHLAVHSIDDLSDTKAYCGVCLVFSLGASGAVSAVFTVSCLLFPDQRVRRIFVCYDCICPNIAVH